MKKIFTFLLFGVLLSSSLFSQECAVLDSSISETYTGKCKKGLAHGEGVAEGINKYEGNFKKGMKHKEGIYTWKDAGVYQGVFFEDKMHGLGKYTSVDSVVTQGYWKNDKYVGENIDDFNGYKIINMTNISRKPTFIRTGEGNDIIINIDSPNNYPQVFRFLNNTSGQIGNKRITNVDFPFSTIIKYRVLNTSKTFVMDVELSIVITEGGIWNITINHN